MKRIKPGIALWRQDVGDIPVRVIKLLGSINGEKYYEVEGLSDSYQGKTGVPESELIQEEEV